MAPGLENGMELMDSKATKQMDNVMKRNILVLIAITKKN